MTVKELRSMLVCADGATISVFYDSEEYDITEESPVQAAFDNYVADSVSAPQPFQYKISLKQEYVVKEAEA